MPKKARIKPSAEIRELRALCGVFDSPFLSMEVDPKHRITREQAEAVSVALKKHFDIWWDTWVEPELTYLAKRGF